MSRLKRKLRKRSYCPPRRRSLPDDLRQCPVAEITWIDAASSPVWSNIREVEAHHVVECRTVGYILTHTAKEIKVLRTISTDGGMGDVMAIPSKCLQHIRLLRKGRRV